MSMAGRSVITIDDLSNEEVELIFSLADQMNENMSGQFGLCQGKIMATLFYEPSTRTRLSFEAAMHRLGGSVISSAELHSSSLSKGESIADTARVVGSYADIIVIRHPWEGAARIAADYAGTPVINAGDGGHEHPTQTLCDLYTLKKERRTIKGLRIALCGDLKHGRTVHSLAYALARFGAETIIFCPAPGLEMPDYVIKRLSSVYGGVMTGIASTDLSSLQEALNSESLDALYMTPRGPHQLALLPEANFQILVDAKSGIDALYITRFQKERATGGEEYPAGGKEYPVVNRELLKGKGFRHTLVMHPLPRVDELAYEMDTDPRSMYFKQAARGVPVRMALSAFLLGVCPTATPDSQLPIIDSRLSTPDSQLYSSSIGLRCENPACVSVHESHYVTPEFTILSGSPLTLQCVYCERERQACYVGNLETDIYHSCETFPFSRIKPNNRVFFDSEEQAQEKGFHLAK